ncbi:MAG: hypothetical protein ABMA64_34275 [Myxococcota bacterium]
MLIAALFACEPGSDGSTPKDTPSTTEPTDPTTSDPTDTTPTTSDPVTFHQHVAPLLGESCARCHNPVGLGPGDYLDYATASAWAEVMIDRIDAGEMPPPAADPACHPYQDAEVYQVNPALRDLLQRWVDQGKPEGDAASAPPIDPWVPESFDAYDLELRAKGTVVPQFQDGNEYRCFLLGDITEDTYATGVEFLMDHPEVSHHALLLLDTNGGNESNVEDEASGSWPCGLTDMPGSIVHAWAPSNGATRFPEGTGLRLPAGSQLVLQMHYFQSTSEVPADRPGYGLTLSQTVDKELYYLPVGPTFFSIPAGDPDFTKTFTAPLWLLGLSGGLDVWGVFPHMHVLGTAYDFHAEADDGTEKCISQASEYDFSMQPTYWFDEPVHLDGTDSVSVACTWDNSAENPLQMNDPPENVTWGENTQQEMCYAFFYVTVD